MIQPQKFVHLHLHTEFSLVDGMVRVKPLMEAVADAGMAAVALTDMSNLFAMIKFYKAAVAKGIKPIIGADIWFAREGEPPSRMVLLCQNTQGYRNLTRLISRSYQQASGDGRPLIHEAWLRDQLDGLIGLSGGREGEIGRALIAGQTDRAASFGQFWSAAMPDRFYLEIQRTGREHEEDYIDLAAALAADVGLSVAASNDVRFLKPEDFDAHEARVCINDGRQLSDPRRERLYSDQQYLRTADEMAALFADMPEALENSVQIARRCNLQLDLGKSVLPDFPVPAGMSPEDYFVSRSEEGLESRLQKLFDVTSDTFAEQRKEYDYRLAIELKVINQMGFAGYFLIVSDFIAWARNNDIPVGPGRGSGAGSLVAYALGITDLDPLEYDLLFERFLNPERVSMPDFDIDFCMEGRDRVIDYVSNLYGRESVSQIATHGTMAAKAAVRDGGRVLGHPYPFVDRVAKLIPNDLGITLDKALAQDDDFRAAYEDDEETHALIDLARSLEGLARNVGKHAGGVVISPTLITDFSPLYCEPGSTQPVTQFDKNDIEAVGLVKFDFLGLRTLTIIDWAVKTINSRYAAAGEPALDLSTIPLKDEATFKLLKACSTTSVFQLESSGMKDLIKRLQPDEFEEIIALVALFRPGPLQSGMVDDFINRKHGRARVEYPHPDLEPILKPTYGVILYQEQVMQIAQVLAHFTLGGADLLRRAMGKKDADEMAKQRSLFVEGATAREVDEKTATYIFDLMEKFAGYGFNKSHSAAYALVSYQTAWLKTHHPAAFMAAVLSADMDNTDKVVIGIEECRQMELAVVPPSVNASQYRFTVNKESEVVYGLGAIKGVGEGAIEGMLAERESGGLFKDIFDLCRRVDLRKVNRRVFESLIRSGALDDIAANRATSMKQLPEALRLAEQNTRNESAGQVDLFGLDSSAVIEAAPDAEIAGVPEWEEAERLLGEKEVLGLYLTGHPINRYESELAQFTTGKISAVLKEAESYAMPAHSADGEKKYGRAKANEKQVVVAGLVVGVRTRVSARGSKMAFLNLDDRSARIEIRLFAEALERFQDLLVADSVLVVRGKIGYDDFSGGFRMSAEEIYDLEKARELYAKRMLIKLNSDIGSSSFVDRLAETLQPFREGTIPIVIDYLRPGEKARIALGEEWNVKPAEMLIKNLGELLGQAGVELEYE